jgi:hypothetical protein
MKRETKLRAITTTILIMLILIATNTFIEVKAKTYTFTATIYPGEVSANHLLTYTATITDTGTSIIGSTGIVIPTGFTVSEPIVILAPPSSWSYSLSNATINFTAITGGASLSTGESIIFTFTAIAPASAGLTTCTTRRSNNLSFLFNHQPRPKLTVLTARWSLRRCTTVQLSMARIL